MNPEIIIRKIKPEEAAQFAKFSSDLFAETFNKFNDPQDMENYLAEAFNLKKIEQELANPNTYCFYATKNSMPIGCIKVIIADASFTGIKSVELSRLYVSKEYHKQKIGATLMAFAIDFAIKNQAQKLWLGVWEHNQKAIDFYHKWGFIKTGIHNFKLGNDVQQDWLLEKVLA
ncbi:MAG: GNAT family N-acetyltransferase [Mucilaginibacter sp.]|uniref:GNAT family N-acetyltransferase n=1 Tax=Mucilaginibacter sp. TaxID=1882438 RepID=UPI0034E5B714